MTKKGEKNFTHRMKAINSLDEYRRFERETEKERETDCERERERKREREMEQESHLHKNRLEANHSNE